jgi:hypothetical protein
LTQGMLGSFVFMTEYCFYFGTSLCQTQGLDSNP